MGSVTEKSTNALPRKVQARVPPRREGVPEGLPRHLHGPPRHRQHVALHEAVHAGNTDRREKPADGRRNQAHEQRDEHADGYRSAGVDRERLQSHHHEQEDDRQHDQQDIERDLVRRLGAARTLDEPDHAVQEGLPRISCDSDNNLICDNCSSSGNSTPVTTRFTHNRS